jgi:transcriptional regulator with XRE-family HTH domain
MMETWLPRKLRILRVRQGLTLVEAAKKTGVTRVTLSELERGHREPVAPTLVKIAEGYGVPIEELLEPTEQMVTSSMEPTPPKVEAPLAELSSETTSEEQRHSSTRRSYPYPWMEDTLAETIGRWHEASLAQTDPKHSHIIACACLEILQSVLRYDVPGKTLNDRVPEDEFEERVKLADWLDEIFTRAYTHYQNSEEANPAEVVSLEEHKAKLRRPKKETA